MKFNAVVLMIVAFTFAGFGRAQHGDHGPAPAGSAHQASGNRVE